MGLTLGHVKGAVIPKPSSHDSQGSGGILTETFPLHNLSDRSPRGKPWPVAPEVKFGTHWPGRTSRIAPFFSGGGGRNCSQGLGATWSADRESASPFSKGEACAGGGGGLCLLTPTSPCPAPLHCRISWDLSETASFGMGCAFPIWVWGYPPPPCLRLLSGRLAGTCRSAPLLNGPGVILSSGWGTLLG